MKRLLALLLALSMVISLLPATVLAEEMPQEDTTLTEQLEEPEGDTEEKEEPKSDPQEKTEEDPQEDSGEKSGEEDQEDPQGDSEGKPQEEPEADPEEKPQEEPKADPEEKPQEDPQGDPGEEPQEEPMKDPEEENSVSEEAALEEDEYSGACGIDDYGDISDNLTWRFDPDTGTLTIEGQGDMWGFWVEDYNLQTKNQCPWADLDVKTLVVGEGVTRIHCLDFINMTSLTHVELPDSLQIIMNGAFYGCTNLTGEITFGKDWGYLYEKAFAYTGITKVILPPNIVDLYFNAFTGCESLTDIDIEPGNKHFQSVDGVLYSADRKELLFCPPGRTGMLTVPDAVETIADDACRGGRLSAVALPLSLTKIGANAFQGIRDLQVHYAGSFADRDAKITIGEGAFEDTAVWHENSVGDRVRWEYDEESKTLTIRGQGAIEDYGGQGKTDAPWGALDVRRLVLEEGITRVGECAFQGMSSITGELALPSTLKSIGQFAFSNTGLTSVHLNEGLKSIDYGGFSGCNRMTLAGGFPDSLETVEGDAFSGCSAITGEIRFGSSLKRLGLWPFSGAGITKVTLPKQLTAEGYSKQTFSYCRSLTAIEVEEGNTSFRSVDGVLYSADGKELICCPGGRTEKLTVPDGVEVIGEYAFVECHLTEVELPASLKTIKGGAFNGSRVTKVTYVGSWEDRAKLALNGNLGNAKWYCTEGGGSCGEAASWDYDENASTLTIKGQGTVTKAEAWSGLDIETLVVSEGITAIDGEAFAGLGIVRAELPASLAECTFADAFSSCGKLTAVQLAEENKSFVSVDGVIYNWDKTELLLCPAGKTQSLSILKGTQTIAAKAFYNSQIQELFLPASVKKVGENAFYDAALRRVSYPGTQEEITIGAGNEVLKNATWKDATDIGQNMNWTLENGVLTITGTGKMDNFTEDFPAPWQEEKVTGLAVSEGVTYLGRNAFVGLPIKTMTLPESLEAIGENAFAGTPQGIRITYAGSNERWAYGVRKDGCGLNSPNVTANGENVSRDLTWSFDAETKTLTFSGSGEMAYYSEKNLPDWLAWGIPAEKAVFSDNVTSIGDCAFLGMTSLKQVTLPKKLERIGSRSFQGSGLTGKLIIPENSASIIIHEEAFRGTAITSLKLPFAFTFYDNLMFADCNQLTTVIYPGSEEELRQRRWGASGISQAVMLLCQAVDGGDLGDGVYWTLDKQGTLTFVTRESTKYGSVPDFGSYADTPWAGLAIKKLVIPESISAIGDNAFDGCKTLPGELTLPKYLVRLGDNAFAGTGIKTLRMQQNLASEEMEDIREHGISMGFSQTAFAGSKLTDVYYSGAESSLRELLGEGHPLLKKKLHCASRYGGWDNRPEQGIVMEWAIDSKGVLSFPTGDMIPDYKPLDAPWSGYKVTGLNVKGVTSIGTNAFYGLYGLTKLSIPNTVKTIGDQAFYGCTGVTGTLTIPEGVTEIGDGAFGNLPKITALKLPASLESLGDGAFDGCRGLKTVTFAGSMAELVELDRYGDLWYLGAAITCQDISKDTFECGAKWTLDSKNTLTIEGTGPLTLTDDERDMLEALAVRKVVIKPGITEIGEKCFYEMSFTEVSLPEGLAALMEGAFYDCQKLTKLTLPASLEWIGYDALNPGYLKTLTVAKGNQNFAVKNGALYSKDMKTLLWIPAGTQKFTIPDSVTSIGSGALKSRTLTSLTLGAGITRENMRDLRDLLYDNNVSSLSVSKKNRSLKAVDNVLFEGTTLVLYPYARTGNEYRVPDGTTDIASYAFVEREDTSFRYLERLTLPDSVKQVDSFFGIWSQNLELVVLGTGTEFGTYFRVKNILCLPDSTAKDYAEKKDIPYTLLAQENVTLTFEDGDTGATGIPKEISVTPGGKAIIPKKAPSRKGYTFLGWQEKPNNTFAWSMPIYQPGATLTLTEDMTLVPLFRKNGLVQEGSCGPDTRWTLDKKGTLTISGQGEAYIVLPENTNRLTVKKLVIEEGVTSLERSIFQYVTIKGQVTIPASMEEIGAVVFASQTGITGVSFASSVQATGLQIDPGAFYGCTGIKGAVTLPAQLRSLNRMTFEGCPNITALNTATTVTMGGYSSVDGVLYQITENDGKTLLRCPEGKTGTITIPTATISIADGAFQNSRVTKVYYQNGEAKWKNIRGRENLPVYPTFAYEIQYSYDVESPSFAHVTMRHANPNSILASQTITLKNATMQGYIFKGWYNADGKKVTKIAKGTKDTVKLEARFTPITYTVAYNANGGKGKTPGTPCKYDEQLTIGNNKFTRTGYTFAGWNTAKNGTGTWYYEGQTPKDVYSAPKNLTTKNKGTVTLYAQWVPNSYTVKFDANVPEGMQYSGTMEPQSFTYDKAQALTANGFARTGYTFTGWKTQPNSKTVYKNKASVKNLTSADGATVTLYAQWAARKITVVFHSNYPNGAKEKTAKQTVTCGKVAKLAKNTFAAKGYTFAGWSRTQGGEKEYDNLQAVTLYEDGTLHLYAVWTPVVTQ